MFFLSNVEEKADEKQILTRAFPHQTQSQMTAPRCYFLFLECFKLLQMSLSVKRIGKLKLLLIWCTLGEL